MNKLILIPIFAIVDTNSDPTLVDYPIPANDDAAKSISLIISKVADTIIEARQKVQEEKALRAAAEEEKKSVEEKPVEKEIKKTKKVDKES